MPGLVPIRETAAITIKRIHNPRRSVCCGFNLLKEKSL